MLVALVIGVVDAPADSTEGVTLVFLWEGMLCRLTWLRAVHATCPLSFLGGGGQANSTAVNCAGVASCTIDSDVVSLIGKLKIQAYRDNPDASILSSGTTA